MTERRRRQSGLSLVEIMVGMVILAVVSSQALGMLASQLHTFQAQKRVIEVQEDSRLAADMMIVDIRMAGFMVPEIAGIVSNDGGATGVDTLCTSEWAMMDQDELDDATERFDRSTLTADVGAGDTTVDLTPADMDIDGDGDDDFVEDAGIIISNGTTSHCARITNVAGATVTFTPGTAGGLLAADSRAVPAIIYEVIGTELTRNTLLLSNQVEDIQIEYAVDLDDDGLLVSPGEFWLDSLDTLDHTLLRSVRLSVLTRTSSEDVQIAGIGRHQVANHVAAATADDFRRRLVTLTANPRNL